MACTKMGVLATLPEVSAAPRTFVAGPRTFVEGIDALGPTLAVVDRDGRHYAYGDLVERSNRIGAALGRTRRLVFVEATNTFESLAAYVGCLRAGHPVYLWSGQDRTRLDGLVDVYRPNAIISSKPKGSELDWMHRDEVDLHADLAVLLSTSGSTGSPKLVKLSRRNIDSNAHAIAEYLALNESERAITTLPFSYSYGMSVINSHFASGAALVLTDRSVTDSAFWQAFRSAAATSFAGVPYTYESLLSAGVRLDDLKTLRYATQAGGRLDPAIVSHFARLAAAQGWRFVVMYGQTEAAPRIAYLPADQAVSFPHCIGIPIPGGRLELLDDGGREVSDADTPGELTYSGPSVMMGYATHVRDLATDETPARLRTGDVACRAGNGFYYIVGRSSRLVKPFGLRVNLDDVESWLQADLPGARCAGDDQRIVIAVERGRLRAGLEAVALVARSANLPEFLFHVVEMAETPRLPGGKVDYQQILEFGSDSAPARRPGVAEALRLVFSKDFARTHIEELAHLVGVRRPAWNGVAHLYSTLIGKACVRESDTFRTLAGDSLSYVQVSVALTDYLGELPPDWPDFSVQDLEQFRATRHEPVA